MKEIFSFILLRSPKSIEESETVTTVEDTDFIKELDEAKKGEDEKTPRDKVVEKAKEFIDNKELKLNYKKEYLSLFQKLKALDKNPTLDKIVEAIKKIFNREIEEIVKDVGFQNDKKCLSDFIHALKIVIATNKINIAELIICLKVIHIIESVAKAIKGTKVAKDEFENKGILKKYFEKSIRLSAKVFPLPSPLDGFKIKEEEKEESEEQKKLKELATKADLLERSIESLLAFRNYDFKEIEDITEIRDGKKEAVLDEKVNNLEKSIKLLLATKSFELKETEKIEEFKERENILDQLKGLESAKPNDNVINLKLPSTEPLTLTEKSIKRIGEDTKKIIEQFDLDLKTIPVSEIVTRLNNEHLRVNKELAKYQPDDVLKVLPYGNLTYQIVDAEVTGYKSTATYVPSIPETKGTIKSVGVGDLLVVKEQIKKYEGGEVAHIENVLKGEFKERVHRKLKRSEETFIIETERIVEEEQELTTTERFELQQETSKIISEEVSNKAGAGFSVSAGGSGGGVGYSFYIDGNVNGYVDYASSTATEESTRKASNFSRDVTTRAASRITERIREEQIRRVIQEVEETNKHGIDNSGGGGHISGVYQWVNKIYEAQVLNYGRRMLFDFMIPEPSAFLRKAVEQNTPEGVTLTPPDEFTLKPNQLTTTNFYQYVKKYNVTGVKEPPEPYITVAKTFNGKSPNNDGNAGDMVQSVELSILDGYEALSGHAIMMFTTWASNAAIDLAVGKKAHRFNNGESWHWTFYSNDEVDSIPVAMKTFRTSSYSITVEIKCQRTDSKLNQWKLETYDAIKQQYLNLKSEYEEQLAAAQIQEGIRIQGRNPEENRRIERSELKKHCLSIVTNQHYDLFDSIDNPDTSPEVNIPESLAEGRYIRFFEQAFEWEHLMSVYYPYFWSRKDKWFERVLQEDTDPLHAEFLKAGSARVVVAVSENFEAAISHFLETGEIPEDEELLDVTSPLYQPIVDEIKERQGASGDEIPLGEPWEVRLPTTLVKLRDDDTLPKWKKEADGTWQPDN